uniref:Fibronectin type-III domain-containing protein n=1 Tax=Hucho hucho TaxID=62062 RepID=A0A4W5LU96_9TELE
CVTESFNLLCYTDGNTPQSQYLDRSVLFHRIEGLNPETVYIVSIHAVYGNTEGPEISLSQLTASVTESELIQAVKEVKVVDVGVNSFKLAWRRTPGVTGYKISWSPFHGEEHTHACMDTHPLTHKHTPSPVGSISI